MLTPEDMDWLERGPKGEACPAAYYDPALDDGKTRRAVDEYANARRALEQGRNDETRARYFDALRDVIEYPEVHRYAEHCAAQALRLGI